jgi:hypothetical protein
LLKVILQTNRNIFIQNIGSAKSLTDLLSVVEKPQRLKHFPNLPHRNKFSLAYELTFCVMPLFLIYNFTHLPPSSPNFGFYKGHNDRGTKNHCVLTLSTEEIPVLKSIIALKQKGGGVADCIMVLTGYVTHSFMSLSSFSVLFQKTWKVSYKLRNNCMAFSSIFESNCVCWVCKLTELDEFEM